MPGVVVFQMASALQKGDARNGFHNHGSNERSSKMKVCRRKIFYHLRVNVLPTVGLVTAMVLAMAWVNS
jgi:hypothetical protein